MIVIGFVGRAWVLLCAMAVAGAGATEASAASADRLLRDCRDGVIHDAYTQKAIRRSLRADPPEVCAAALRFELAAVSVSDDVIRDCYEDGRLDGRYTRDELRDAERNLPSDVDEYSNCRSVIVRARDRALTRRVLARRARRARLPLTVQKARRYAQRVGARYAGTRTRIKYAQRVGVRAIRLQAHYERSSPDGLVRCFAEILVTRSSRTGRVTARRRQKVCA